MPKVKRELPRGAIAQDCLPEVRDIYERARNAGVSMLFVCRQARIHHAVVNRWRRAEASPTLTSLNKIRRVLQRLEQRSA